MRDIWQVGFGSKSKTCKTYLEGQGIIKVNLKQEYRA